MKRHRRQRQGPALRSRPGRARRRSHRFHREDGRRNQRADRAIAMHHWTARGDPPTSSSATAAASDRATRTPKFRSSATSWNVASTPIRGRPWNARPRSSHRSCAANSTAARSRTLATPPCRAEAKALASGNPLVLEKANADSEYQKLRRQETAFHRAQSAVQHTRNGAVHAVEAGESQIAQLRIAASRTTDVAGEAFTMRVGARTTTLAPTPRRRSPNGHARTKQSCSARAESRAESARSAGTTSPSRWNASSDSTRA